MVWFVKEERLFAKQGWPNRPLKKRTENYNNAPLSFFLWQKQQSRWLLFLALLEWPAPCYQREKTHNLTYPDQAQQDRDKK
jgi:hypothetical protein